MIWGVLGVAGGAQPFSPVQGGSWELGGVARAGPVSSFFPHRGSPLKGSSGGKKGPPESPTWIQAAEPPTRPFSVTTSGLEREADF